MTKQKYLPDVSPKEALQRFRDNHIILLENILRKSLDAGDTNTFLASLGELVKAKEGFSQLAKKTGLGRESLYKALSERGNPEFRTVLQILDALGMRFKVEPVGARK